MLHIGHQREELDIELEGKKLTQGNSFVYIGGGGSVRRREDGEREQFRVHRGGGAVCGDGKMEREREVCRRAQAGANAWRAVEEVTDRRTSKRLKG